MPDGGYDAWDVPAGYKPDRLDEVEDIARVVSTRVWSPCIWPAGRRLKAGWVFAECLVLDVDKPTTPLAKMMSYLECSPWSYVVGFTKSHMLVKGSEPPCERYRVVIPAERIEDLAAFEWNMHSVSLRVGSDVSCTDGARFYWPCTEIYAMRESGDPYIWESPPPDLMSLEEKAAVNIQVMRKFADSARLPNWIVSALRHGVLAGGRHKRCYALGASLTHYGMEPREILARVLGSPLAEIGKDDVERAVNNGVVRARLEAQEVKKKSDLLAREAAVSSEPKL